MARARADTLSGESDDWFDISPPIDPFEERWGSYMNRLHQTLEEDQKLLWVGFGSRVNGLVIVLLFCCSVLLRYWFLRAWFRLPLNVVYFLSEFPVSLVSAVKEEE